MIKRLSLKSKTESGFTLVEVLVAVALFSVVISVAVGGFTRALRTQRQTAAIVAANDNVFLALEQMAREIRTGYVFCSNSSRLNKNTAGRSVCNPGQGGVRTGIAFISGITGETIEYCLSGRAIHRAANGECGVTRSNPITGDNVSVEYLVFGLSGQNENDGQVPRITISLGVKPSSLGNEAGIMRLQTTVSSRQPDT